MIPVSAVVGLLASVLAVSAVPSASESAASICEAAAALDDHTSQPRRVETHDACRWGPLMLLIFGDAATAAEGVCIASFESGGDPDVVYRHPAGDGTIDQMVGMFQLNHDDLQGRQVRSYEALYRRVRTWSTARLVAWLKQPVVNIIVTGVRHRADGWRPWPTRRLCGLP